MKLLFIAAEPMEFPGILSHSRNVRPVEVPVDWARRAHLAGNEVLLAANGAGFRRAAAAVDAAAHVFHPDAVVSTGFCGALDADLSIGEILVADSVAGNGRSYGAEAPLHPGSFRTGRVCSVARVAGTQEEKARLRASGACAVEMEAAGVAERTLALGVPFYCIRAISDLAGETLANDLNAALRPDGHFATMKILRGAFRRPATRLPELVRLRRRAVRAARALGDFIASCRF